MRDIKFAVMMSLVIVGMVVGMALAAAGCTSDHKVDDDTNINAKVIHLDSECYAAFWLYGRNGVALSVTPVECQPEPL